MVRKVEWKQVGTHLGAGFMFLGLFIALMYMMPYLEHRIVGCEGIGEFVTGDGFWQDYHLLITNSENGAVINHSTMLVVTSYTVQPPSAILNNASYDCKTISQALFCLAREYNETCLFITHFKLSVVSTYGHRGVACWNDGLDEWVNIY